MKIIILVPIGKSLISATFDMRTPNPMPKTETLLNKPTQLTGDLSIFP